MLTIQDPDTQLCVSGNIFAEYEEVIRRPRLNRSNSEIAATLRAIHGNGFWLKPAENVYACSDPDDNMFLECAQAAAAHYLVRFMVQHADRDPRCS